MMVRGRSALVLGLVLAAGLAGCSASGGGETPPPDSQLGEDGDVGPAGGVDAGPEDAGLVDAGPEDAGLEDAGPEDAGPPPVQLGPPPPDDGIFGFAGGCYAVQAFDGATAPSMLEADASGEAFAFSQPDLVAGDAFRLRPSDLGTYLLYDADAGYLTAVEEDGGWRFARATALQSSLSVMDNTFVSPAEWVLEASARDPLRYQLRHRRTQLLLDAGGLTADVEAAAIVTLFPRDGCAEYPELPLDASGTVTPHAWDDGDLYGIAEIHSHLMSNFGFGGGGIFHGAPFHRLGVEHALPDCAPFHGEEGRRDLVGMFYDHGSDLDPEAMLPLITEGESADFNHHTAGYPVFTDWPNARKRATHQTMYYRWLERAWMSGLRLLVQHATGNSVLCDIMVGIGSQQVRYECNDMVGVDRAIEEMRHLERYIDAQAGGPGQGWLRVVESPGEARAVIEQGRLAVVLGIEISNLFDCFSTPKPGFEACTPDSVRAVLDHYRELGVRVVFPVHKYDNAFSAGDGAGGIIELGNFINSGHYSNFVEDCPGPWETFDDGNVTFGGLNKPRDEYDAPPPVDTSGFADDLLGSLLPFATDILGPSLKGEYCQKHGMTDLGETLLVELMKRGMLIDIAHLPQRSVTRAYELLEEHQYPATKTHGKTTDGRLYNLGGLTGFGVGRCGDPNTPGTMVAGLANRVAAIVDKGGYPAQPLTFDLNGFAGAPGPRFGPESGCGPGQVAPVTYPFTSHDGQVTFEAPHLGDRAVDFNTEGMIHIGLFPELIEDLRRDGATPEQLEPLFRSAEAYVRMWEKAEARALELADQL